MIGRHPAIDLALRLWSPTRGEAVITFLDDYAERRSRRVGAMLEASLEECGLTPDELFGRISQDEDLADLFVSTANCASRTSWEAKLRALGHNLADAAERSSSIEVETADLIRRAIEDMQPAHARALDALCEHCPTNPTHAGGLDGLIAVLVPGTDESASQIAAVLQAHGLVSEPFYSNGIIEVTPLGLRIRRLLVAHRGS